ncbi:Uncharacterized protein TCAP_05446 [Tolypocladium capitatum]|uniref:Thioesterase domain-containing protein n=1 Tax=Tolypocladium capitatum TaxID=45235 RepID=A0A2K3QAM9_9HYPO|nr:Uncharacterized protein TCAP_05446 [Tolypocladium capitatum]
MFPDSPNPTRVQDVPPGADPPMPLILIHDAGGTTFSYFLLGSLHRDVWAIHNPKYLDAEPWEGGMDEMARHYVDLIVEAGISGTVLLGGWSLGGYLSLAMARMLADDPSINLSIAGCLMIDSPYHVALSKWTVPATNPPRDGLPDLVLKSFDLSSAMLQHWDLPSWDGPACGGQDVEVGVAGRSFTLAPGTVLYKPLGGAWKPITARVYRHEETVDEPRAPPPAVVVRCTRSTPTPEGVSGRCRVDFYRDETLLGWEGNHADFVKAVFDIDDDHISVFDTYDRPKMNVLTAQLNECLEVLDGLRILDGLGSPSKQKPPPGSL